jgi:hypothetical protein
VLARTLRQSKNQNTTWAASCGNPEPRLTRAQHGGEINARIICHTEALARPRSCRLPDQGVCQKITRLRQRWHPSQILEVRHMWSHVNIQCLRRALFHRWLCPDHIRSFKPHAMLFDPGGTAKSRNFAHARVHRRPVHRPLAFGVSKFIQLVDYLYISSFY